MKPRMVNSFLFMSLVLISFGGNGVEAFQDVKVENHQLKEDFNHDGVYRPFFVHGVGYSPLPIGDFNGSGAGWSALCYYSGHYPQALINDFVDYVNTYKNDPAILM